MIRMYALTTIATKRSRVYVQQELVNMIRMYALTTIATKKYQVCAQHTLTGNATHQCFWFHVWDSSVMLKRSCVSQRLTDTSSFNTVMKVLFRKASGRHCRSASRARKLSDSRR